MDEQEQQRVARHAAVFLAWLENLPTVGRPDRGDPAVREWAEAELERLRTLRNANPHPSHEERGGGWRA
ncbi:hypothetical protein [uncultured Thermomonospora sp.]|uniref:hypothetical protein n=1 Tax=uncultured Thermomonospora sp. TaxID=671175 RepID=UPI00259B485D|nr:hypothetical protein [uncultured Thermomonospora sp.]